MPFESIIDRNDKISTDFKQIAKECFSSIYETLGKRNFTRWVLTSQLSKDVKNLVFDWMSEEEKEEYPNWDGFAESLSPKIKIRKPSTAKETSIHEVYHLITRNSPRFITYINEGLTEYLKGMTSPEGPKTYMENVRMAEFLHKMLGDSFIKAYLLGKSDEFDKRFAMLVSDNPNDLTQAKIDISNFYKALTKRHNILHPYSKEGTEKIKENIETYKNELNNTSSEIQDFMKKVILGKVRNSIRNMDFYEDGKLAHLDLVSNWIKMVPIDFRFSAEEGYNIEREALSEILDQTHLFVGLDESQKNELKEKIISSIVSSKINGNTTQFTHNYSAIDEYNKLDPEIASKIFEKSFENPSSMSILDFVDKTLTIKSHIPMTDRQLDALISQYAIKVFGEKANVALIDSLIKQNLGRFSSLYNIEQQRERETIESKFRKIGDNAYIEKRDNQYFYLQVDKDGNMQETELSYLSLKSYPDNNVRIEMLPPHDSRVISLNKGKDENSKRRVFSIENNNKVLIVSLGNGFSTLQIHGLDDKYGSLGMLDIHGFRELEMLSPIINQIRDNINNQKYMQIINDAPDPYKIDGIAYSADIDTRSRSIDFESLMKDLSVISALMSDSTKSVELQEILISDTLDRYYGTSRKVQENGDLARSKEEQASYDSIIKILMSGDLDSKALSKALRPLNDSRKERIEKDKKYAAVIFTTPEAEKKYFDHIKIEEIKKQGSLVYELSKQISTPGAIPIRSYFQVEGEISEDLKNKYKDVAFGLKGYYLVGPNIDDRDRRLLTDKLIQDLSAKTGSIHDTSTKRELIEDYIRAVISGTYEISRNSSSIDASLRESYDNIVYSLTDNILDGTEIDEEKLSSSISALNENRKSKVRDDNKKSGHLIEFRDETSRIVYEQLVSLSKQLPQSEFDKVAEGLVNAANKQYDKGEKDGDIKQQ